MAGDEQSALMETPFGILSPGGNWYFISRDQIQKYTPGLLDIYSLEFLLKIADRWMQSSSSLSLIAFAIMFILQVNVYIAFIGSILIYLAWSNFKSAFVTVLTSGIVRLISNNIFIYVFSLVFFSYLGIKEFYEYLIMAFILFIIVKFPLLKLIKDRANLMIRKSGFKSEEDKVFNMVLIKYAMSEGILTKGVKDIETQLFDLIHYNRNRKNG